MEMISKIMYSLKQGLKGVFSNKTMSFISVVSITSVLAILGIVSCIVLNINSFMEKTKDEVNEIRVSLDSNLTKDKSLYVKEELERLNGVISVKYQTKDEAFESMKARELAEILMQNPDWEVLINPDELRGNYMGCPYQQTIQSVEFCFWKNIPVDGKAYEIKCKNHFVAERGYKL